MTMHQNDELILVDEFDNEIGSLDKYSCHLGEGQLHRAFSVFLINSQKELLIQKRSSSKFLWGNYWSNSCCSHPRCGESIKDAAIRRTYEELSVTSELTFLYSFKYQATFQDVGSEHELCHVFFGKVDQMIEFNEEEISEIKFVPLTKVKTFIQENRKNITPWFKLEWNEITNKYLDLF